MPITFRLSWQCGTYNAGTDEHAADGYLRVMRDGVAIYNAENLPLYMTFSTDPVDLIDGVAFGYFGLLGALDDIEISMCAAPDVVTVPDVVGLSLAVATAAITAVGLVVGLVTGPGGLVVSQSPIAGTIVEVGTEVDIVIAWPALVIIPPTIPNPQSNAPYSQQLSTTGGDGGPCLFTLLSGTLPPGLTLSAAGLISGTSPGTTTLTPTSWPNGVVDIFYSQQLTLVGDTVGDIYSFTVQAEDAAGNLDTQDYTVTIADGWTDPTFEVISGVAPKCLTCTNTGLIHGYPMKVGTTTFTVQVTNFYGSTITQEFTLTITS